MNDSETLVLVCVVGAAAILAAALSTQQQGSDYIPYSDGTDTSTDPQADQPADSPAGDLTSIDGIMAAARNIVGSWHPPAKYADAITQAETANAIPRDMLARLLWQESRYREDIINGTVRSSVGAMGIAQFMPATARELGIDPLDPFQAIPAAGRYLAKLYRMTGTWAQALAAYNWGIGNVLRRGLASAPTETRNYYSTILADVSASTGTTWA